MGIKYKISDHAERRFRFRFRHIDSSINSLIESSVVFGGQKGSEYLLLNETHGIVFPIVCSKTEPEHIVKTVLTLDQAKANISLFHKITFDVVKTTTPEPIKKEKPVKIADNDPRISTENIEKLKEKAKIFFSRYGYFPTGKEKKKIFREIKAELPVSNKNLDEYFLCELGRLIRERNKIF
jgi:hypothetical protein